MQIAGSGTPTSGPVNILSGPTARARCADGTWNAAGAFSRGSADLAPELQAPANRSGEPVEGEVQPSPNTGRSGGGMTRFSTLQMWSTSRCERTSAHAPLVEPATLDGLVGPRAPVRISRSRPAVRSRRASFPG